MPTTKHWLTFGGNGFVYLELLLVNGKAAGLDVEKSAAAETQHVLVFRVPGHAVGVRLLQRFIQRHDQFLF